VSGCAVSWDLIYCVVKDLLEWLGDDSSNVAMETRSDPAPLLRKLIDVK
jgi:hypothetical protein